MTTSTRPSHHHGNLRAALVAAGTAMLESDETFSLRAVARRVGVSPTAPYRHFPDKEHLEAAVAAEGFRALRSDLMKTIAGHEGADRIPLADLAATYVDYAVRNPALYHLMFGQPCGQFDERRRASSEVFTLIERSIGRVDEDVAARGLATAAWALSHGLASLHLDGKLDTAAKDGVQARVREACAAIVAIWGRDGGRSRTRCRQ
ncbi:TetR/AcrR family transcriptional regulator [Williamsia sterculiae]|uniref:Transcriptional regulator, TetR family n=1 Tax=Williamsia sterculiae TaxID=1344003 RepID=A0A1N7D2H8_9NOCA|nr:TetR/AcrR family transcriptional regulator [Williamsia sterculiae]SIR69915.1 transcriptional regulator, TetR family [Williamsia sterculiae]